MNPYKIVAIGQKKILPKKFVYARIKVSIVSIFYMGYSKLCYALLNLKKVMIFACFNVMIYIEFGLFDY